VPDTTIQTSMSQGKMILLLIVYNMNVNIRCVECEFTDWVQTKYKSNRIAHL